MSDGAVVMEAEAFHVQDRNDSNHAWESTAAALASGGRCVAVKPDVGYQWADEIVIDFAPRIDFRVNFTTTGTFYIHLRGDPGQAGVDSDSCFAGLDGSFGPAYDFDDQEASWSWRQQGFFVNTTGPHTLSVWAREDGFCLDKVVLSTEPTSPTGAGPAQSPQE